MASKVHAGKPFGLDSSAIKQIDWPLALKRVIHDLRSDFIYAPHLSFIYAKANVELIDSVKNDLKSGKFSPAVPLTIEVPKSFRMRVKRSKRLGPHYSRPGSILLPADRLVYQAFADQAAPFIRIKTDRKRSFSHRLGHPKSASMFIPTRVCWSRLQKALANHSHSEKWKYIMKVDVANFFGSLNQHTLMNVLNDAGYPTVFSSRLEALLTSFAGERSSRGILQGVYPSDLLGNFYLAPIDRFFSEYGVPSARYVDDIYVFVESTVAAAELLHELIPQLRTYDLVLNEAKSAIMPKSALATEEPDLEALFADAVDEIAAQIDEADFDVDYGFQSEWSEEELDKEDLELQATKALFDSISGYPGQEETIERFCLPLFSKADSDYAVAHVLDAFKKRPAMTQIYAIYLAHFLHDKSVSGFLSKLLKNDSLADWQKLWIVAALSQTKTTTDATVKKILDLLVDPCRHDALRAVAGVFVGRFGDHARRKQLTSIYKSASSFVQAAIYYSSRFWPDVERATAKASWGTHSTLNKLLTTALSSEKA